MSTGEVPSLLLFELREVRAIFFKRKIPIWFVFVLLILSAISVYYLTTTLSKETVSEIDSEYTSDTELETPPIGEENEELMEEEELIIEENKLDEVPVEEDYLQEVVFPVNTDYTLKEQLDHFLQDERLDHALAAVHIRSEVGEEIYSYHGDKSAVPASGQKILVGAAALDTLGRDFTFNTGVYTVSEQIGNVLAGDIYLKGTGDPTMLPEDYQRLAEEIANLGITTISGDVVADDTYFDDVRLSIDLSWANQKNVYGAQVSALTLSPNRDYDAGSVMAEVRPGANVGEAAAITIYPATDYVKVINNVETVASGGTSYIEWDREHGNNVLIFNGTLAQNATVYRNWVSVWEPTELVLQLFYKALQENGINVEGEPRLGDTPSGAQELANRISVPLEDLFHSYMKLSNNSIGEILTKTMGKVVYDEGSWDAGLQVVEAYLRNAGLNMNGIHLRDGSGMSHLNAIPPEEMTKLLYYVKEEEWYDLFYDSFPIAGVSNRLVGGTLGYRMGGTAAEGNVRGKTGTLTSKNSLSGFVTTQDDEELMFSIILNNYFHNNAISIIDNIVVKLAEYSREGQ
ncbi:D-alanyl-D-alanine carboxypeptidase/D-alanyl-D-alanine-endopeptidase [Evansella sp. AB-P1]|uniref:D-alanyl-D-alanine carboxypeptidase/D-alanyl-D-alanine endopeptidase n=1 Tax=Evansella sp. AB-P1 TaxID=3037653 RepID=UPI00241C807A|nr:D-alanyl-D-alanine carboxypeptidase/D-alanyl-D-alanine-endopeptidase [Evansella sp. AB-P1]MDG5789919.1 D-alanyl-D-alanine carboxypeptidase/D-alanyl-D-alanine-endopeptidase [Evansella sp. AB-P1]